MEKEQENLVLEILRGIRSEIAPLRDLPAQMADLRSDFSSLRSEMNSLRADVASDFVLLNAKIDAENKATREQIVGLRRAVVEYHSVVVGHGARIGA